MNEQEKFWTQSFGTEYVGRNRIEKLLPANINLFTKILSRCSTLSSVLELGCNIGANLKAIELLSPQIKLTGVEINEYAVEIAEMSSLGRSLCSKVLLNLFLVQVNLVFTKTVLIHIPLREAGKCL